ncbi:SLAC1 anion channel family protein [Corynebacterium sp. H78]|uniref:SLAC1 anion channel family protein n=1 Tax=Corynebacterium sp. H78 TaxID=3133417 RepID=UPI0030AB6AAD
MTSIKEKLSHTPLPIFAVVMGTAGLSTAWKRAAEALNAPEVIGVALYFLAAITFVLLLIAYLARILGNPANLKADLHHPIKVTFLTAITISLMLVATAGISILPVTITTILWWIAVVGHLFLMLVTMRMWMRPEITIAHVTPAWFIPVVGNVIAPLGGMQLDSTSQQMSFFSFSIGIVMWLGILPIVLYRLFAFDKPMMPKFIPTMFILIAPAAVSASSLAFINGQTSLASSVLFYSAIGFFLLTLTRLPELISLPFNIPHWAMSFPLAALSSSALIYDKKIGIFFLTLTTIIIVGLWIRTIIEIFRGGIFAPEGGPAPEPQTAEKAEEKAEPSASAESVAAAEPAASAETTTGEDTAQVEQAPLSDEVPQGKPRD